MRKKKKNLITNNREIYDKFNMLNFSKEVVLKDVKPFQVEKIVKNINKKGKILDIEIINGQYIIVKKTGQFDFNIYLK